MKFEWLQDYKELDGRIIYLKWNLNKSKLELYRWTYGDLQNIKLEKDSRASSLEKKIEKITQEITLLEEQKNEMMQVVEVLDTGIESDIVRMKYIDGLTLEKIAEKTGYSSSHVRKKHAEIVRRLKFLADYESGLTNKQWEMKQQTIESQEKLDSLTRKLEGMRDKL